MTEQEMKAQIDEMSPEEMTTMLKEMAADPGMLSKMNDMMSGENSGGLSPMMAARKALLEKQQGE